MAGQKRECPGGAGQVANLSKNTTDSIAPAKFTGTDNPRYLRIIQALLTRPTPREHIDKVAGCANGPDAISQIRDLFSDGQGKDKHLTCERIYFIDRDGKPCRPGVYSFGAQARRMVIQWLSNRKTGGAPC